LALNGAVTHHSVTGSSPEIAQVQGIQAYHMFSKGWTDIAYSLLVGQSGKVYEGRSAEALTYGVRGKSGGTGDPEDRTLLAICAIGNYEVEQPSTAMLKAYRAIYTWLALQGATHQSGDRDHNLTACLPLDVTEVLTLEGWKLLSGVSLEDEVASWSADSGIISFSRPLGIVPPHVDQVIEVGAGLEATPDHRLYTSSNIRRRPWKVVEAADAAGRSLDLPVAGQASFDGIPLSDAQLRLLAWVQGDGHLATKRGRFDRLSFHLRRDRKISRLLNILPPVCDEMGLTYSHWTQSDGSTKVEVYGVDPLKELIDVWAPERVLGWSLLQMNRHQFEVFVEELLQVDGCASIGRFDSTDRQTIDVLQALCCLNGRDPKRVKVDASGSGKALFSIHLDGGRKVHSPWTRKLPHDGGSSRVGLVGCLTTENDTLVIRQNGRIFIVGNCPGRNLYAHLPFETLEEEDDMAFTEEQLRKIVREESRAVIMNELGGTNERLNEVRTGLGTLLGRIPAKVPAGGWTVHFRTIQAKLDALLGDRAADFKKVKDDEPQE